MRKTLDIKKLVLLNLPYVFAFYFVDKLATVFRLAPGTEFIDKLTGGFANFGAAFANPLPSFHPVDLLIGVAGGALLKLAVYIKGKNRKKFRQGEEYGSARWGRPEDIRPYMDDDFSNNVILTQTEGLTMNSRPKQPKYARNKNILVIGGSGSGKTRFFVKPNLMQMHSSYVVTDPKGTVLVECGKMLEKNGYVIKSLNTINFRKSMHYNPFAYIRSEKDILKLVNTIIVNTKGDGDKSGEDFWVKAEKLYYTALIGYIWYEAPDHEKNFTSMIENIKYTGVMANHMRESRFIRDKNQRRVPKEEWYIRKNAHEAIVTQEEFDKANEAIQRRRKTARVTHDQSDRVYYCAHCGGKLEKANGTVFACPSHRYHDGSPCEGVYWRKSALEEVLLEALKGQIEITRIESSEVKKAARIRNESLQRQLVLLKAQYDACGREKFTLYEQYREAKITAEEYLSGKDELTRKQAALKEQLEESEALYEANQQMGDAASEQQEAVGKMTGLSDAKLREHLYDAVERVLVYDSESIEIIWKFNEVKNGSSSYAGAGV